MSENFVLRPRAIRDLEDIWAYTSINFGQRQAENYISQLREACNLLSKNKDIDDLLLQVDTYDDMTSLVLSQELKEKLDRVIKEYLKKETLSKYGLANRHRCCVYKHRCFLYR